MADMLGSLGIPLAILVLVGALFIIVQITAALGVGETAAMGRLRRWAHLPEAILRLSGAPNLEAAVQGMTLALAEGLGLEAPLPLSGCPAPGHEGAASTFRPQAVLCRARATRKCWMQQ
jgi:hypothetical protein